jgi:hypothetical protein
MSILLAVERDTPCMCIVLAVGRGTSCTSILLVVEVVKRYTLHIQTEVSGKCYNLSIHRPLSLVSFLSYDVEKSHLNAGMSETSYSGISIFMGSQLCNLASGSVRYRWSEISQVVPSCA